MVPLICDTDIVSRALLQSIDQAFKNSFMDDEMVLSKAGTDASEWDAAMDAYVDDVVGEMEKDIDNRLQGKEGTPEREIHEQSAAMFRLMYSRVAGRPRALPVLTPTMLDEVIGKLKARGLAIEEVSRLDT